MLYKKVPCPKCKGYGYITVTTENSISCEQCNNSNCNGTGFIHVPMTNGDIIRTCSNEQIVDIFKKLGEYKLRSYSDSGIMLCLKSKEGLLDWLNMESNDADLKLFFPFINKYDYLNYL